MNACTCKLYIEVEYFDGLFFAECPDVQGLMGIGDCPEEAANDLLMWMDGIKWN